MAFQLSSKVITLHLDISTAKAYIGNQGDTASTFLPIQACHILNLAKVPGINILPAYLPVCLNMETDYHR